MNNTAIITGSLSALARQNNKSIAETFVNCDVIVIVDVSGSMAANDSRGERSRYDVACEELAKLQANLPGKVGVIAFSSTVMFVPGGQPPFLGGGTNLAGALRFTRVADVPGMRFFLISDGEPNNEEEALKAATQYKNKIDVIYVGPERNPRGRDFLTKLANTTGGKTVTADCVRELAATVERLLLDAPR